MIREIEVVKKGIIQTITYKEINLSKKIILTEKITQEEARHNLFNLDWYKTWKNSEKTIWECDGQRFT